MRTSSGLALAAGLLAGCGQQPAAQPATAASPDASLEQIACAPSGAAAFAARCTVERSRGPGGEILTVRHPDGGFHRLLVTHDGRGLIAADGAEPAVVTVLDSRRIEVAIGSTRYRFPATVGPLPPQ